MCVCVYSLQGDLVTLFRNQEYFNLFGHLLYILSHEHSSSISFNHIYHDFIFNSLSLDSLFWGFIHKPLYHAVSFLMLLYNSVLYVQFVTGDFKLKIQIINISFEPWYNMNHACTYIYRDQFLPFILTFTVVLFMCIMCFVK